MASIVTQLRTQGGVSIQDRYNERYNNLMKRIETFAFDSENLVFVSGHEHTLQYLENKNIKQIVSGSGAKESAASLGDNGLFSYGKQGFAELRVYKDGSSGVSMYGEDDGKPVKLFSKMIFESIPDYDVSSLPDRFPKEIKASVYSEQETDKTGFFESVWGSHYRSIYSTKITAKVATLDTLYGGLEIVRPGGGHQTKTLRLKTKGHKLEARL